MRKKGLGSAIATPTASATTTTTTTYFFFFFFFFFYYYYYYYYYYYSFFCYLQFAIESTRSAKERNHTRANRWIQKT